MKLRLRFKKPWPSAYFFFYSLAGVLLHMLFSFIKIIQFPFTLLGLPLIILGIVFILWVCGLFSKEKTTVDPFKNPNLLVTKGPFRISRHPMYLGFVLTLFGLAILLGSMVGFIIPLAMFLTLEFLFHHLKFS